MGETTGKWSKRWKSFSHFSAVRGNTFCIIICTGPNFYLIVQLSSLLRMWKMIKSKFVMGMKNRETHLPWQWLQLDISIIFTKSLGFFLIILIFYTTGMKLRGFENVPFRNRVLAAASRNSLIVPELRYQIAVEGH